MKCPKCGKEFDEELGICPYCGYVVESAGQSTEDSSGSAVNQQQSTAPQYKYTEGQQQNANQGNYGNAQQQQQGPAPNQGRPVFRTGKGKFDYYLNRFSEGRFIAILGMIVGGIIAVYYLLVRVSGGSNVSFSGGRSMLDESNIMSMLSGLMSLMRILPIIFYIVLICCIAALILSIINDIRYKDMKVVVQSAVLGIYTIILLMNVKLINVINYLASHFTALVLGSLSDDDIPVGIMTDIMSLSSNGTAAYSRLRWMFVFAFVVLGYSIYLFVIFRKYRQGAYAKVTTDAFKNMVPMPTVNYGPINYNPENNQAGNAVNSHVQYNNQADYQMEPAKPMSKKQKGIIAIVVAVVIAACGGYYVWDNFLNFTKIDLAANMKLSYSGLSGNAQVNGLSNDVKYDKSDKQIANFINSISYDYSKKSGIKNGDHITVTAVYDKEKAKALKLKVTNTSKVFTVKGLIHRFSKASDVPSKTVKFMQTKGLEVLQDDYKSDSYDTYKFSFQGTYFIKYSNSDILVSVFKDDHVSSNWFSGENTNETRYYYYEVENVNSGFSEDTINNYDDDHSYLSNDGKYVSDESGIESALSDLEYYKAKSVTKIS